MMKGSVFRLLREMTLPRSFNSGVVFRRSRPNSNLPPTKFYHVSNARLVAPRTRARIISESARSPEGHAATFKTSNRAAAGKAMAADVAHTEEARSTSSAKPFDSIPGPKGVYTIPYLGTAFMFKPFTEYTSSRVDKLLEDLHVKYGPIVRLRLGGRWTVMLEDINDVEEVLRPRDPTPFRPPVQLEVLYIQREKQSLQSLATTNGEEWKRLRTPLNSRMNRPTSTIHYLQQQEVVAEDFGQWLYRLQNSPEKMKQLFFRFGAESIGVVCFNKRLGFLTRDEQDPEKQREADRLLECQQIFISAITESSFGGKFLYRFYKDSLYRKYKEARDYALKRSKEFVEEAMRVLEKKQREGTLDPDEPNFLLSLLSEKSLSMQDVLMACDNLMGGGAESTGRSLQLLFYNLATHPEKQEKLAREIMDTIGPGGSLTPQALAKMPYVKAVVNESLRLFFPLPTGTGRQLSFDIVLSGYRIPAGTTMQISSNRIAKSPLHFDRPDEYIPERWLRGEGGQRERVIHTLSFLPFGFGARKCIGRRFAEQELYLATVKVIQKYKIGIQDNYGPMETTFSPFCSPVRPVPFTFTPRH